MNATGRSVDAIRPARSPGAVLHRGLSLLRPAVSLGLWRHGWWLPLATLLLAAAAALHWQARPADTTRVTPAPVRSAAAPAAMPTDDAQHLAALHQALVPLGDATAAVRRLVQQTQPALGWQRAEFLQTDDVAPGVARLQITVPVTGNYRAMRLALAAALQQQPALSLDQLQLRRPEPDPGALEARLRLSLWLAQPGVTATATDTATTANASATASAPEAAVAAAATAPAAASGGRP